MEENKQHIDELFREALGNYTETPPPAVWDAVEQRLANNNGRRPGFIAWWGWIALLLLIGGGSALGYQYWKNNAHSQSPVIAAVTPKNITAPSGITTANTGNTASNTANTPSSASQESVAQNTKNNSSVNRQHAHDVSHQSNGRHFASSGKKAAGAGRKSAASNSDGMTANQDQNVTPQAATTSTVTKNSGNARSGANKAAHHTKAHFTATATSTARTNNAASAATSTVATLKPAKTKKSSAATTTQANDAPADANIATQNAVSRNTAKHAVKKQEVKNKVQDQNTAAVVSSVSPSSVATKQTSSATTKQTGKAQISKAAKAPKTKPDVATANEFSTGSIASKPKVRSRKQTAVTPSVVKVSKIKSTEDEQQGTIAAKPVRAKMPKAPKASTGNTSAKKNTRPESSNNSVAKTNIQPRDDAYNGLPSSLQGKNEDVRFPTATAVPEKKAEAPVQQKTAVAPDVSSNPIADDSDKTDSGSGAENTRYTMNKHRKNRSSGLEAGIAAGYSFGFAKPAPGEVVISPFIQAGLTDRLSVRFSPSYRFGNVSSQAGSNQTYFRVNSTGIQYSSHVDYDSTSPTYHDTLRNYHLQQNYDSLTSSSSYGGRTWAVELPVTLAYKIGAGISVFGGPVFSYQNTISSISARQSFNITRLDSVVNSLVPIDSNTLKARFNHSGQAYTNGVADDSYSGSAAFRVGYLAGLRFSSGRWQAELSLQQNISGLSGITNDAVKKIYAQPYFRFTIGYSLWKPRRKKVEQP